MTCFIAQNELSAFADDALEMARAAELQDHLSGCASCTRELQEIRRVRTMLRTLPVHRAPADFLSKVTAKAQRKSLLERAAGVLAPVLQLPRPAQASLALAASLVVAVTVFWNNPDPSLSGLRSAPGGAEGFREVANVQAPEPVPLSAAEVQQDAKEQSEVADDELDADLARQPSLDKRTTAKSIVAQSAPPPPSVPADELATRGDRGQEKGRSAAGRDAQATPAPALALRPAGTPPPRESASGGTLGSTSNDIHGASGSTPSGNAASSRGVGSGVSTGGAAYKAPTSAGLYASDPAPAATAARPKNDGSKPTAPAVSIAKDVATETSAEPDTRSEPSFESSRAFGQIDDESASTGDVAGSDMAVAAAPDPFVVEEKSQEKAKLRDSLSGKKEARRERAPAKAGEANAEPQAEAEEVAAVAAPAPAAPTLSAKYSSASASAPADVVSAAKAAGGRLVSPANAPPGLGKAGASTVVTVEIPATGIAAFEDALRLGGTLERGTLPSGAVRYRIEVVRQ